MKKNNSSKDKKQETQTENLFSLMTLNRLSISAGCEIREAQYRELKAAIYVIQVSLGLLAAGMAILFYLVIN